MSAIRSKAAAAILAGIGLSLGVILGIFVAGLAMAATIPQFGTTDVPAAERARSRCHAQREYSAGLNVGRCLLPRARSNISAPVLTLLEPAASFAPMVPSARKVKREAGAGPPNSGAVPATVSGESCRRCATG
jgi:hypothetical protein